MTVLEQEIPAYRHPAGPCVARVGVKSAVRTVIPTRAGNPLQPIHHGWRFTVRPVQLGAVQAPTAQTERIVIPEIPGPVRPEGQIIVADQIREIVGRLHAAMYDVRRARHYVIQWPLACCGRARAVRIQIRQIKTVGKIKGHPAQVMGAGQRVVREIIGVVAGIHGDGQTPLLEVAGAYRPPRVLSGPCQHRQQQCRENGDDGDNHQ